ncbi:hypothetical protein Pla163_36740 [Planctomycetes bacterium Pla163]|uniref:Uncharacterized protein n=1 Tax=Rohdeia mirabilis TaxID=2528008 RepID=A0A518D4X3_9BACT|nr:hypothetical protein Pla163_36740 [Planctomycetes bacterium Pla163]
MSDNQLDPPEAWEFYPCQMEEGVAWFAVDLGVADVLRKGISTTLLALRIELKEQRDGVTTPEEFEVLRRLTEPIEAYANTHRGRYVGHYTCAGVRHAYVYADLDEETARNLVVRAQESSRRAVRFYVEEEPEHQSYFELLHPTADDWQVIMDMRVIDGLREKGDPLTTARCIDHFAYMPDQESASDLAEWLKSEGYAVDSIESVAADDGLASRQVGVRFTEEVVPSLGTLRTVPLRRACSERGGEYDGWGCSVL